MFVRDGEALGSIKWDEVPKSASVPAYDSPQKQGARKKSSVKLHEEQVEAAGDSFPTATPADAPEPEAEEPDTSDESEAPNPSDTKAVWVDFAVSQGADQEEAEGLTKKELVEIYG